MTGIYVPWLVDAARLSGYPVVEIAGWRTRGHGTGMAAVEGVVCHHTAGPKTGEFPSLAVVRDGRADLAGPLANFGLGRSGTVYVMAAGVAWHAGASQWESFSDLNARFLGIEAEDDGDGVWTIEQLDCYPRLCAALAYYMRRGADRICAHRECATPAGRKPDPTGIDMPSLRARVAQLLTDPTRLIPRGGAAAASQTARRFVEDDVMYIKCQVPTETTTRVALLIGPMFVGLGTAGELNSAEIAIAAGAPVQWVEPSTWAELDRRSHALCDLPTPVTLSPPATT